MLQQLDEEDRLGTLTDDILLSILGRVSSRMAARTTVLSTRWTHLPWLLPELSINVKDFLSAPCADHIKANDMEQAMASLTKATRSLLDKQEREFSISSLHLNLYLISNFLCEVGQLIGDAIDSGLLKDSDLTILDEMEALDCSEEELQQRAQDIDAFFTAYPSVFLCLTKLSLKNIGFDKLDMHHVLFDSCKQLKHLTLYHCDTGSFSLFKIDAPGSKLRVLEIESCRFLRIDLVCLPKLEKFLCRTWVSQVAPLTFGFVPSLGELVLSNPSDCDQRLFRLSELLHGVTGIHTLTLDFQGETLWLQPEMKELRITFNQLRKLSVCGIFVEFDISWTTAFLVAARSIEMLHIEVWEHTCDVGEARPDIFHDRRNPQWEMHVDSISENMLLKELEFAGFKSLEQQFAFIRSILERSPNLQKIVLRDEEQCDDCDALKVPRPSRFPRKKDEQEMVVKRIRDGMFSPEIYFYE
uniref:At1g61320/AtMIF1 LRR domain-containing protein n=1 Tax=Hordeum vulgare subsp. vulgare TaxID=112509 RepID=A0A8I6YMM2_HORVV